MHIGSQVVKPSLFDSALERLVELAEKMRSKGFPLQTLDLGGGLGANYEDDAPSEPKPEDCANAIRKHFGALLHRLPQEPGRALVADAGVLLTRVLNDLMRPALYDAHHDIVPMAYTDGPPRPRRLPEIQRRYVH